MIKRPLEQALKSRYRELENREERERQNIRIIILAHRRDIADIVYDTYKAVSRDGKPEFRRFYEKISSYEAMQLARDAGWTSEGARNAHNNGVLAFDRLNRAEALTDRLERSEGRFMRDIGDDINIHLEDYLYDTLLYYLIYFDVLADVPVLEAIAQSVNGAGLEAPVTRVVPAVAELKTAAKRETFNAFDGPTHSALARAFGTEERADDVARMLNGFVSDGIMLPAQMNDAFPYIIAYGTEHERMFDLDNLVYDHVFPVEDALSDDAESIAQRMTEMVREGVIRQDEEKPIAKAVTEYAEKVEYNDADRVLVTEGTRTTDELAALVLRPLAQSFYSQTMDDTACDICKEIEKNEKANPIPMDDYRPFDNAPPFHPRCRCHIEVVWDDSNKQG